MTLDILFLGYEVRGEHRAPDARVPNFRINNSGEVLVRIAVKMGNVKTAVALPEVAPTLGASEGSC